MGGNLFGVTTTMSVTVIIGPSGAGKSTVARLLQEKYGFRLQKTVTTRPQRNEHDTDHIFVNEETFQTMSASKAFFGTMPTFEYNYGLPKFDPSDRTLLLLRAPVMEEFKTRFPDAHIFEIDAPLNVLEKRLIMRDDYDRIDPEVLEKEIALGRSLAQQSFNSSHLTPEEIADQIAQAVINVA